MWTHLGEMASAFLVFIVVLLMAIQFIFAQIVMALYSIVVELSKVAFVFVLRGFKYMAKRRKKPNPKEIPQVKPESA